MDKKSKKKKSSRLRYLNPKNLMTEIHRYGYHFSLTNYLKFLLIFYFGIGVASYLYGLQVPYVIFIMIFCSLFYPFIILSVYRNMYEQKKFVDITAYMEQLLFSFKKKSKIRNALIDTLALFPEGQLREAIEKAINHIETSDSGADIYQEAFAFIEEEYGCKKLYTIHDFLIKVEAFGGEFERNLEILLGDEQLWIDRVYEIQSEKKKYKRNITICVIFSYVIIGMAILMLPKAQAESITQNLISQIITTTVVLLNFIIWFAGQQKLSGSWINIEKEVSFSNLSRHYNRVMHEDLQAAKKKGTIIAICLLPLAVIFHFAFHYNILTIATIIFALVCGGNPGRVHKMSVRKVTNEVEKAFPEWLMEMALLLQSDNVHVSLSRTIDTAPPILREELERLLSGIDEDPNSIEPYIHFFDKLDVPDVITAMKMLYSMAEFGADDIASQIGSLVKRNSAMMDKAARLYAEDYLAGVGFLALLPMLTSVFKLIVDLILSVTGILSMTSIIG